MKIQKKYQGAIPLNRIANEYNESEVNTYSTNYINERITEMQETMDETTTELQTSLNDTKDAVNTVQSSLNGLVAEDVTDAIALSNSSIATFGAHSSLMKYGPIYVYQVSFSTATALSANTAYELGVISSDHRPSPTSKSIQGIIRANNDIYVSFWISGGSIQIYPPVTIASGANLAGSFTWINL